MSELYLPVEVDMHFKYVCKKCSDNYWINKKEAYTHGFKIVCYCGNIINTQPLTDIKVTYKKSNLKIVKAKQQPIPAPGPAPVLEAYRLLRNLGHSTKSLNNDLMALYKAGFQTKGELVKQFLSEQ